jgi:sulfur-carrier protein
MIRSEFTSVLEVQNSLPRAMKGGRGRRYSKDYRRWPASGVQWSRMLQSRRCQDLLGGNHSREFVPRETTRDEQVSSDKKVSVPVTVYIPGALREFSEGQSEVELPGAPATLADALSVLWIIFPGLRDRVATETGEIRQHINIFIGEEDVRFTGGLASRIPAGAEISIVPSITGG